jgi:Protein of unknown function (DUF3606)
MNMEMVRGGRGPASGRLFSYFLSEYGNIGTKHPRTQLACIKGDTMRHAKPQPIRNKIDLADPSQIRILRRRLGISADDLLQVVAKVGNSIAAVCKEIEPQKAIPVTESMPVQLKSPPALEVGVAASAA